MVELSPKLFCVRVKKERGCLCYLSLFCFGYYRVEDDMALRLFPVPNCRMEFSWIPVRFPEKEETDRGKMENVGKYCRFIILFYI